MHCHIEFEAIPIQVGQPRFIFPNTTEGVKMTLELEKLIWAGVIERSSHEEGEYISPVFSKPKKNGSVRIILNLKQLNENVEYHHYKMDNRQMAGRLMTRNCYMASIDIKQAYYMVPIAREHRKFLKFWWRGTLFQFTVLPNGLACAPRLFTKLLKPVYSTLRNEGVHVVGYIDDSFIAAKLRSILEAGTIKVANLLQKLGFLINRDKSIMTPNIQLQFSKVRLKMDKNNPACRKSQKTS